MARETKGSPAKEQKLERYGVWVKVEPRTVAESQESESSIELTDLEGSGAARASSQESTLTLEEEKLLDELDTELGPSGPGKEPSIPDEEPVLSADEELPDISEVTDEGAVGPEALESVSEEELPELQIEDEPAEVVPRGGRRGGSLESNEVEVPLSSAGQERFEDLDALETELASVASSTGNPPTASSEVLARIEDELRSIRADLTQLRNELSGIRKGGGEAAAVAEPASGTETQGGFFDEDEDETIALTGDELDNILNTAEITEEAAEAAPLEEAEEITELPEASAVDGQESGSELLELSEPAESAAEELPTELELEELSTGETSSSAAPAASEALPELDLEGIPEIESPAAASDAVEEVGDLETLDLEEESTETAGAPEAVGDFEKKGPVEHADEVAGDIDLEALAAEAEELESDETSAPVQDLEIGELETVAEEAAPSSAEPQEIEIAFESEPAKPRSEAMGGAASQRKEGPAAIPDDLKDEIRTVLQYMDRLLENLPDDKIKEFAESPHFVTYKKLFEDLGLSD